MGARALTLAGLAALCGAASSSSIFPLPDLPNPATFRRLQTGGGSPSGEAVCENHGFDEGTCLSQGCCHWDADTSACWSSVGPGPCSGAMVDPCQTEGAACVAETACASILQSTGQGPPDMEACADNAECSALMQCSMSATPPPPPEGSPPPPPGDSGIPAQCQTDLDACIADIGCVAAMMVTSDAKWRPCLNNKLCRPVWLCAVPPCTPKNAPGCILQRFLITESSRYDAAHEFGATAYMDKEDPLHARLYQ